MLFPGLGRSVRQGPYIQDLGQSFSRYGRPAREITSIYFFKRPTFQMFKIPVYSTDLFSQKTVRGAGTALIDRISC